LFVVIFLNASGVAVVRVRPNGERREAGKDKAVFPRAAGERRHGMMDDG
jgi:hypothetical protein